jgi:FKBP-type peptidyl-prolyl cis-trans isomerase
MPTHRAAADCVDRERGLTVAAAAMRAGERARLRVAAAYGFGPSGSFSFPSVPPTADLEYEVEMLGFSEAEEREVGDMLFEERLDAAKRARLRVWAWRSQWPPLGTDMHYAVAVRIVCYARLRSCTVASTDAPATSSRCSR